VQLLLVVLLRISYANHVIANFRQIPQISLPWQSGSVVEEFDGHRSIARPRKPPVRRKDLGDISRTSHVIANFARNFVAMATRVGRGRI